MRATLVPRVIGVCVVLAACLGVQVLSSATAHAQAAPAARHTEAFVVEYYYKARWGYADEFIRLFKKNHFPVLDAQIKRGRMLSVTAVRPRYHSTEDGRWDYRVTIVFKDLASAFDATGEEALIRQLYPDQETFKREEQRRFEILDAHWDVPLISVDLSR